MSELLVSIIILVILVLFLVIVVSYLKIFRRKYVALIVQKALSEENKNKIKDENDIKKLEEILKKYKWYSNNWWINLTPIYHKRYKVAKKIIKKYDLNVELFNDI